MRLAGRIVLRFSPLDTFQKPGCNSGIIDRSEKCQQVPALVVRTALFSNGERFPLLMSRETGIPFFEATIYAASELRGRNLASNTILQAMRSVMVLYIVLGRCSIDLDQRLGNGNFLENGELEEIALACKSRLSAIVGANDPVLQKVRKVLSIEKARMAMKNAGTHPEVEPATAAIRLNYIRDYLGWFARSKLLRLSSPQERSNLIELARLVDEFLKNRIPLASGRNDVFQRCGLSPEGQHFLARVISPADTENPWSGTHTRARNALIIRLLLKTGLRRGEFLGLRVEDINTRRNEIVVFRRPDDADDPRLNEPNTKTRDRVVPIDDELGQQVRDYVAIRRRFKRARGHGFLLVANGTGEPMSVSSFNRIFQDLQGTSALLCQLTPHVLRHTFNDNLSDTFDATHLSPEQEIQIRNRLNGWSEKSQMAAVYTKRHVQRKAAEAIRSMQKKLTKMLPDEQSP